MQSLFFIVLVLFAWTTLAEDYCSEPKLCGDHGPHVTCDPDFNWQKTCPSTPHGLVFDDQERDVVLKLHNMYRNQIASGQTEGYESAAGMPELTWDKSLEEVANANAQACVERHDKCRATSAYPNPGQNLALMIVHGKYADQDEAMKHFVGHWFDQHKRVNKKLIESYHPTTGEQHADNFARMVNDQATRVGCSLVSFEKDDDYSTYFVCNYDKDVEDGKPVYKEGKPCSKCPKCSTEDTSLCAA